MTDKTITPPQVNQPKGSGSPEFDGLLAAFHAIVWATAEDDDPDLAYDEAGNVEAKKLQAMYRALQSELTKAREGADKWKLAHRLATEDNFKLTKALELLTDICDTAHIETSEGADAYYAAREYLDEQKGKR